MSCLEEIIGNKSFLTDISKKKKNLTCGIGKMTVSKL